MNYDEIVSLPEFEQLLFLDTQGEDSIALGQIEHLDFTHIESFFSVWTHRIDNLISLDKSLHGHYTNYSDHLTKIRGFTYSEYSALHNFSITSDLFAFYPIFNILAISKGGINTEKQRADFTLKFQLDEDDYIKCLLENGAKDVLNFFFGGRLKAYLPLPKLKMHSYIVAPTGSGKSELIRAIFY
jgi:hypothetical protein